MENETGEGIARKRTENLECETGDRRLGGVGCLRGCAATRRHEPRLELLERIALAPRQSLALVEAEGRRLWWPPRRKAGRRSIALDEPYDGSATRLGPR